MKQVYLFAILSMLLGWIVGDMMRPLEARKIAEHAAAHSTTLLAAKAVKQLGAGTIEVAANLHDDEADKDLPSEVIDARTKGQTARERALKEAIGKIFPKDGDWGKGGPLFPMDAFYARPRPRPEVAAPIINAAFYQPATPFPVFPGPSTTPWFAPGDPRTPPHITWVDVFPTGVAPVPEPSSWALMILGFVALALRLRGRKAELQSA